jgi:predicted O-methyltransferase YrrM
LAPAGASPAYVAIERIFAARRDEFAAVLDRVDALGAALRAIAEEARARPASGRRRPPRFDQAWFPTLDACAAYTLIRGLAPRRIVEVGSGHSTRFLARALADGAIDGAIVAIDPQPRADISDLPRVSVMRQAVHRVDASVFAGLDAGDVLFVDSSHVLMPGSDVDLLFNRVLPDLPAGVIVHVHDIALPDDYPSAWAWRNYNEQLAVVPLLTSAAYMPLFASHYVHTHLAERLSASVVPTLPAHPAGIATSLWLRKG